MKAHAKTPGMETLGERLAKLREQAKETQEDVAKAIGVIATTVSRWERNVGSPHAEQLVALAKHFATSTDHLLLGYPEDTHLKSPEFHRFLATEYGRIAQERGWVHSLLTFKYPIAPTVQLYKNIVHAFLMQEEEGKPQH